MASRKRIAGFISAALVGVFFVAGWWPFHVPKNGVSWVGNGNGLRLHDPATLWSSEEFSGGNEVLRSIEIRLRPDDTNQSGTILAFQTKAAEHFYVAQSQSDLELEWHARGGKQHFLHIPGMFRRDKATLITIVSGEQATAVYADGILKRTARAYRFAASAFAGRLIVGTTPFGGSSWSGQLLGLALYNQELSAQEVGKRYAHWVTDAKPEVDLSARSILALYPFDKRAGTVASDEGQSHFDLQIPTRFQVLYPAFLQTIWRDYRYNWGFWEDILLNIIGFVPFGFFLRAYLSATSVAKLALCIVVFGGFLVSLTIEVVQVYLPTRSSDSRDLLTNTLGAFLGTLLYSYGPARSLYESCADWIAALVTAARRQYGAALHPARRRESSTHVAPD